MHCGRAALGSSAAESRREEFNWINAGSTWAAFLLFLAALLAG